jgi:hypothetical protein
LLFPYKSNSVLYMASTKKSPLINITNEKVDLRKKEVPLVDIKVTNPITYIKSWWKKVLGGEGIDLRLKVKPLTAVAISFVVVSVSMGVGRFVLPVKIPFFEYSGNVINQAENMQAFVGTLHFANYSKIYYLVTNDAGVVTVKGLNKTEMDELIGKKILVAGEYDKSIKTMKIEDIGDVELIE